jgi:outer membrane protein, heavy metal efflux system
LGDLYQLVSRHHPRVVAAQALARATDSRVATARRPPDPQLQLGIMNRSLPSLAPMRPLGMAQLQLMQMVPWRGKLSLAGRAADAQSAVASVRTEEVAWELRTQLAMPFYDLWATHARLEVARETLRLLHDIARTAEAMYRVGEGRQADVLRARVEIARMTEDTLRMHAMRETMVVRLNALLDRDSNTPILRVALPRYPDSLPPRAWLDSMAMRHRPMVRAGEEQVRAAQAEEALARRELVPDVQVGVQYGRQRGASLDGMPGATEHMASLMVGASIPVFARSRQLRLREEAAAMRLMAQSELAAMRAETRGRIGELHAALQRARRLSTLYLDEILPQAEATVASSLAAYRVGGVDFMTLLENRMSVNRYRQEVAALAAEEGKAWAELEMLAGRELLDANQLATDARDPSTRIQGRHDVPTSRGER